MSNKDLDFSWVDNPEQIGEMNFTFDGKKIFNLFQDYPYNLTDEEKRIFDERNPYWTEFFKDRTIKNSENKAKEVISVEETKNSILGEKAQKSELIEQAEDKNVVDENVVSSNETNQEDKMQQNEEKIGDEDNSMNAVIEKLEQLQKSFDDKIAEDEHKNKLFDNMHKELTAYQNGAFDKVINAMAMDIIQLVDSIKKSAKIYEKKEPIEENYKKLLRIVKGLGQDLEDILYRQSIEPYSVSGKEVDVKRQKIIQIIDTEDQSKDNTIATRTAVGYEKEGKILRPERIKIYKYNPNLSGND